MSSATVQVGRTVPTSPMNSYVNQSASPFVPREAITSAMHLTEHLEIQQVTGLPQPGGTCTYELPYEVDAVKSLSLVLRAASGAIPAPGGGAATSARLVDYFGLAAIEEISVKFGTERIQIVRPLELFQKLHFNLDNDKRHTIRNMVGGGLTAAQRFTRMISGEQQFVVPLLTLMGLHLGADLSQTLFVRAMTERWRITIKFSPVNSLYEADGTFMVPAGGAQLAIPVASTVFTECYLLAEGVHVADSERKVQEQIYMSPRRMLIREHQYCTPIRVSGATSLTAGAQIDISLREINQPCTSIYVLFRWATDLDRICGGAGGSLGTNRFNVNGWWMPGGTLTTAANGPIITHLEGRVGSNAFWLKKTRVQHLLDYERARVFKGSGVQPTATGNIAAPAIPIVSFSHDPTRENAALGFIDFSQSDNPVLRVYFGHQGVAGPATINAAATTDIGANSDLEVLVIADTITQLNFARGAALRLAN